MATNKSILLFQQNRWKFTIKLFYNTFQKQTLEFYTKRRFTSLGRAVSYSVLQKKPKKLK